MEWSIRKQWRDSDYDCYEVQGMNNSHITKWYLEKGIRWINENEETRNNNILEQDREYKGRVSVSKHDTYDRLSAVVEYAGTAALVASKPFQTPPLQNHPDYIQYLDGDSDWPPVDMG